MFRKNALILLICLVICVAAVVGMIKSCADEYFADLEGCLYETLDISQASYDSSLRDMRTMRESEDELLSFGVRFGAEILSAGPASYGRINELNQVMPECSFYYVADDGDVVQGATSENIDDIAEIARMAVDTVYSNGSVAYSAHRLWGGVLVVASNSMVVDLMGTRLNRGTSQIETIYWDMRTGEQFFSSKPEVGALRRSDLVERDVDVVGRLFDTRVKVGYNASLGYFAHIERKMSDIAEITAYISLDDVIVSIIRSVLSELILLPIVIVGMFYFFSVLPRSRGRRRVLPHLYVNEGRQLTKLYRAML